MKTQQFKLPKRITTAIDAKIIDGIKIINSIYGVSMKMPHVEYINLGRTAGTAWLSKNLIQFNPILLVENEHVFIENTVPHELAHLACELIYPQAHEYVKKGRRWRRDLHGDYWKEIMVVLEVDQITRCHSYNLANVC